MSENLQNIFIATSALSLALLVAVFLTIIRKPGTTDINLREKFVNLFLIGVAFQCLHFAEEFITHFYERFPRLLGFQVWSAEFFVAFNLSWICVWILSALGVKRNYRLAFFPVWFFAIGMTGNGIVHPLLALAVGGYFPGLITSPVVGVLGVVLLKKLYPLSKISFGE
jgi:hypothetical protein